MGTTLNDVSKDNGAAKQSAGLSEEKQAAVELVRLAKSKGLAVTGPDGCWGS